METLGERVKRLRTAKQLTQEKLAEMAGLKQSTIVGIEKSERTKRPSSLIEIANALGVDAYYLKYGVESIIAGDKRINEVARLMEGMASDGRAVVLNEARKMASEYPLASGNPVSSSA